MSKTLAAILMAGLVLPFSTPARADLYCIIQNGGQIISAFHLNKLEDCRFATESAQKALGNGGPFFRLACHPPGSVPFGNVEIGGTNQDSGTIVSGCH